MSQKILIVETSLAVRGIAESLLRQNGYEVVSADTVAAAREILRGSKIDLLMVASDIYEESGRRYFEVLGADSSTAMLPLLVLHDSSTGEDIAYPPEAIINKPFTPRDFLEAVAVFGGGQTVSSEPSALSDADIEDAIIDSALGLDKIEVDEAEVMDDDTSVYRKQNRKKDVVSMIGYEYEANANESTKIPTKNIDAIIVPPDVPQAPPAGKQAASDTSHEFLGKHEDRPTKKPADMLSESSKIEIVTDQYGISVPEESLEFHNQSDSGGTHDYDWFLKELRKESGDEAASEVRKEMKPQAPHQPAAPARKPESPAAVPPPDKAPSHTEAVDKFISEFRKEMEKITGDAAVNIEVTNIAAEKPASVPSQAPASADAGSLAWEEGLERITPTDIRVLSRQLVEMMAGEIAGKIVARLDEDVIYHMIKESIDNLLQRRAAEISRRPLP